MRINVEQPDSEELVEMGVEQWPILEHDEEKFEWFYDKTEYCYIISGEATIVSEFDNLTIKAGDFVTFPAGLECVWDVQSAIRKRYTFE